jgi:3-phenylpropionate/trans-cinnamate dioxygenase ferredoxin subunit
MQRPAQRRGAERVAAVDCPFHVVDAASGAHFEYKIGEAMRAPACINLRTWPVKVEDGDVFIEI